MLIFFILNTGTPGNLLTLSEETTIKQTREFQESLAYRTLADCKPSHPVQVEYFQGTGVWLNCLTHTSTPRADEAFESHATGLDQT